MESQKIYGRNVCPREKPHLQKIGTCYWVQHWPDGWKQSIITWRDTTVPQAFPREPVKSAPLGTVAARGQRGAAGADGDGYRG